MKRILVIISLAVSLHASEWQELPREIQEHILTYVAATDSFRATLATIASLRRVNRSCNECLRSKALLRAFFERVTFNSGTYGDIRHRGLLASPDSLVLYNWQEEVPRFLFWMRPQPLPDHGERVIPPYMVDYFLTPFTPEQKEAVRAFFVTSLLAGSTIDTAFVRELSLYANSKAHMLDSILAEMRDFYGLERLAFISIFEALYSYTSLEFHQGYEEIIDDRYEKFKLLIPFFIDMCQHGMMIQEVRELIRLQVREFADLLTDPVQKKELARHCLQIAQEIITPRDRIMLVEIVDELEQE